jgi:hypothetical protein
MARFVRRGSNSCTALQTKEFAGSVLLQAYAKYRAARNRGLKTPEVTLVTFSAHFCHEAFSIDRGRSGKKLATGITLPEGSKDLATPSRPMRFSFLCQ